jgi:hypothetical protein
MGRIRRERKTVAQAPSYQGIRFPERAERLADFQNICAERKQPAWVIGQVVAGSGIEVLP